MKIMLINPNFSVYARVPSLPLGIISIASYLNANGHQARIFDGIVDDFNPDKSVEEFRPDIVGISAMSFLSSVEAKRLTAEFKKKNIPVVWGGQAPTSMPDLILNEAKPDYIILGEGEITWLELVNTLENGGEISAVAGLAYIENEKVVYTPHRPVADISLFPDIDWNLVDVKKYFSTFFNCNRMLYLHASKGCPAQCTFCSNQMFHQSKNRCRNIDQVMRDIDYLYANGMNGIYFSDELFIPDRKLRTQLCNLLIERNYNLVWGCQMRVGVLNEDDINLMYKAGCRWILFGIESGNTERIRLIKKNIDLNKVKDNVQWCEKAGITVQASFMIGFPGETVEETKETIRFANLLGASIVNMSILVPLPNSEIYTYCKENNLFEYPRSIKGIAQEIEQYAADSVLVNLSDVPSLDLKVIHNYYQWKAFIGKDTVNDDSYGIIKKMASDTFDRIFKHGIKGMFYGLIASVNQLSRVYFYSHFFRKILKKYGL